ncbi:MAG: rRNA maturation RNase YbeY [Chitinophagales bacterium]
MNAIVSFTPHEIAFALREENRLRLWIERIILSHHCVPGNIHFIFCSDMYLSELHTEYLKKDSLTDIITFNYNEGYHISGDIFISIDRVRENAETFSVDFERELQRVMIHGVLHLIGFNDKSDAEIKNMRAAEDASIEMLSSI